MYDLRRCAGLDGRAVARLAGRTATRGRLRQGLFGEGQRRQDRPAGAGQGDPAAGGRRRADGHAARSAGQVDARPAEHPRRDQQGRRRLQVAGRCLGRHDHGARPADADRPGRAGRVRARADPGPYKRRQDPCEGQGREIRPAAVPDSRTSARRLSSDSWTALRRPMWRGPMASSRRRYRGCCRRPFGYEGASSGVAEAACRLAGRTRELVATKIKSLTVELSKTVACRRS